jgi:hypothetical protein
MQMDDFVEIGDTLSVIPITPDKLNLWHANCSELPNTWSCRLKHRAQGLLTENQPLTAWVIDIDVEQRCLYVSDSNFGFLPISDRMRPRYVAALRHLILILAGQQSVSSKDAEFISEVKGMFSRCVRRDQWDWYSVWNSLGCLPTNTARRLAMDLGTIARDIHSGNIGTARSKLDKIHSDHLTELLMNAAAAIESTAPRLTNSTTPSCERSKEYNKIAEPSARNILASYSKEKLDHANDTHRELVRILANYLNAYGHRVETNQFIDAFTRLKSGPAIFEAKSISDQNELSQIHHGLSQLYEYRFRHQLDDASLWLLLSCEPNEKWLIGYLENDRKVHLLWVKNGRLAGPSLETLLESGTANRQRKGMIAST